MNSFSSTDLNPLPPTVTGGGGRELPNSLRREYTPFPGVPDEMLGPDGGPQPAWQPFLKALDELGPEEVSRRWQDARQLIRENGVTYNVYGDPRGRDRPVALDPIPF